jgi:hypothetical protein
MASSYEDFLHHAKIRRVELKIDPQFLNLEQKYLSSFIKSEWDGMSEAERASLTNSAPQPNESSVGLASASNTSNHSSLVDIPKLVSSQLPAHEFAMGKSDVDNESVESFASERRKKKTKVSHIAKPKAQPKSKSRGVLKVKGRLSSVKSQQTMPSMFKPGEWDLD